jgi:hypothetical protein
VPTGALVHQLMMRVTSIRNVSMPVVRLGVPECGGGRIFEVASDSVELQMLVLVPHSPGRIESHSSPAAAAQPTCEPAPAATWPTRVLEVLAPPAAQAAPMQLMVRSVSLWLRAQPPVP